MSSKNLFEMRGGEKFRLPHTYAHIQRNQDEKNVNSDLVFTIRKTIHSIDEPITIIDRDGRSTIAKLEMTQNYPFSILNLLGTITTFLLDKNCIVLSDLQAIFQFVQKLKHFLLHMVFLPNMEPLEGLIKHAQTDLESIELCINMNFPSLRLFLERNQNLQKFTAKDL